MPYTRYHNSKLATVLSFLGAVFLLIALGTFLTSLLDKSSRGELGEIVLMCAIFAAIGVGLQFLAKKIAAAKDKRTRS